MILDDGLKSVGASSADGNLYNMLMNDLKELNNMIKNLPDEYVGTYDSIPCA